MQAYLVQSVAHGDVRRIQHHQGLGVGLRHRGGRAQSQRRLGNNSTLRGRGGWRRRRFDLSGSRAGKEHSWLAILLCVASDTRR